MGAKSGPKPKSHVPKSSPDKKGGMGGTDPDLQGMVPLWIDLATAKTLLTALTSALSKPVHAKDDKGNPKPMNGNGQKGKKPGTGVKK